MNLIDENEEREQDQNKKKMFTIIIGAIIFLVIIAVILFIYSTVKNNNSIKLYIDDKKVEIPEGLIQMSDKKNIYVDENNQIYISVKELATLLNIEFFNDEYKNKGEDTTKCYIKTSNEYTSYLSNTSQIYKAIILEEQKEVENNSNTVNRVTNNKKEENTEKVTEYEYFEIENGVRYIDGEIYASQSAIKLGFNVRISYDPSTKTIKIYTLDALEKVAANIVNNAVIGDDCDYYNKKLLKYGLVLVRNTYGSYGITNYYDYNPSHYNVSCKYSNIRFIESSSSLIVTTSEDNKQGILKLDLNDLSKTAETKIEPNYQLIRKMDENKDIYLIKESGKYGVIRLIGDELDTIIKPEYQQIGLNNQTYKDMDNKYIINNKYIPVKLDDRWGIYSTEGILMIVPQYPGIGCNLNETGAGSGDGVVVLPEIVDGNDGIVFLTDLEKGLYCIINVKDGSQIGLVANEIYSKYENDTRNYYMKIAGTNGAAMRNINIYKLFGRKVQDVDNLNDMNNVINNTNTVTNSTQNDNTTINNSTNNSTVNNNENSVSSNNTINNNIQNTVTANTTN